MSQTILGKVHFKEIAIRVNDRAKAIDFYTNILGFKLLREENALAFFSTKDSNREILTIEESPAHRTREVRGKKKLHAFSLLLPTRESLLSSLKKVVDKNYPLESVFTYGDAVGFRIADYEGNRVQVYYSPKEIQNETFKREKKTWKAEELLADFSGSAADFPDDIRLDLVKLNAPDMEVTKAFFTKLFDVNFDESNTAEILPGEFRLSYAERQGEDLIGHVDELWDIEYFQFTVDSSADLKELHDALKANGAEKLFMDKKETLLILTDTQGLEWWFTTK
jgi:catechol 2,3-dioxygenase